MKRRSIKTHLSPYSIVRKRATTLNHAFASAIAPVDTYDDARVSAAIRILDQDPDGDLQCVYCGRSATTWDHLVGLVKDKELHGYGHQIGNLVPCCRECNSKKGAKQWEEFLREITPSDADFSSKKRRIAAYLNRNATAVNLRNAAKALPHEWDRYVSLKAEILRLLGEADTLAIRLREKVASEARGASNSG